jgi:transposase-like protein
MRRGDAHARARGSASGQEPGKGRPGRGQRRRQFSGEHRLGIVKLHTEEGVPLQAICRETGISQSAISRWVRWYRQSGEDGLKDRPRRTARQDSRRLPDAVRAEMVALKRENASFGVKRISQFLRRMLHLPGSPETVRRTLHAEGLIESAPPKREKAPPKPRFFERSTPNQLWQTDIFTFRLAGKNAYLIGFIDDYSRWGYPFNRSKYQAPSTRSSLSGVSGSDVG